MERMDALRKRRAVRDYTDAAETWPENPGRNPAEIYWLD